MIRVRVINPLRPAAAAAAVAAVSSCTFYITITTLMDGENGHWWHTEKKRDTLQLCTFKILLTISYSDACF